MATSAPRLAELLAEVTTRTESAAAAATTEGNEAPPPGRAEILLSVLRAHHYWPAIQVKKFYDRRGLVLLHNTYKRIDVTEFQELYDECRSVVLDLNAPEGENVVVTLANGIPRRVTDKQYESMLKIAAAKAAGVAAAAESADDVTVPADDAPPRIEVSYEGTTVYVYAHKDRWYFGTSSCPTVDSSRYFHPTKTHGQMLDEALRVLSLGSDVGNGTPGSAEIRAAFTSQLDSAKAYAFLLVHYQNRHVADYTAEFGTPEYAALIHIQTRDRADQSEEDVPTTRPFADIGVRYPEILPTPEAALAYLRETPAAYGFVIKNGAAAAENAAAAGLASLTIVSREKTVTREECDLGNPNPWVNMLWVYTQNKPHYHISDYLADYGANPDLPKDSNGRPMDPTYVIHTVICTMRDILYQLFVQTTAYYPQYRRFKMNREADGTLPPILRFHLAQLRHHQVTHHTDAILTAKAVFHYICHIQTLKNVRTLIRFFAHNPGHAMTPRQAECFGALDGCLTE